MLTKINEKNIRTKLFFFSFLNYTPLHKRKTQIDTTCIRPTIVILLQFIVKRKKMYNTCACLFLTNYEVILNTVFSFEPKYHCTLYHPLQWVVGCSLVYSVVLLRYVERSVVYTFFLFIVSIPKVHLTCLSLLYYKCVVNFFYVQALSWGKELFLYWSSRALSHCWTYRTSNCYDSSNSDIYKKRTFEFLYELITNLNRLLVVLKFETYFHFPLDLSRKKTALIGLHKIQQNQMHPQ